MVSWSNNCRSNDVVYYQLNYQIYWNIQINETYFFLFVIFFCKFKSFKFLLLFFVLFCFVFTSRMELVVQFPARGSTQVLLCLFPGVMWLWHFLYSVGPHLVSSLHIYPLLCRGHSWRVRLAKQETLTPPLHLVSPLVCRGPWMSTVVLYCWFHSDSASVL